jgi:hypothetical protein
MLAQYENTRGAVNKKIGGKNQEPSYNLLWCVDMGHGKLPKQHNSREWIKRLRGIRTRTRYDVPGGKVGDVGANADREKGGGGLFEIETRFHLTLFKR